jgi:fluoride exporter
MNFYNLFLVGSGGFLGSIARYVTARSIDRKLNVLLFPYGTFIVNIAGSLILGMLYGWLSRKTGDSKSLRLFLGTGFCGGFTTFSAFTFENVNLWQQKLIVESIFYILISLLLGFLAVVAGISIGKSIS